MDLDAALYYAYLSSICNVTQSLRNIVTALTLLACGMSIAVKYLNDKK
jgi:hypothetical protein